MRLLVATLLLLAATVAGSWLLLLQRLRAKADPVTCEQTYMYTSYIPAPLPQKPWPLRRYQLLLYREDGYARQEGGQPRGLLFVDLGAVVTGATPTGYPALFVPGNAGSYQQVRSIASETARLASRIPGAMDIDWYVVDLRSELSAFDGNLLLQQTAFVQHAMRHLAAAYNLSATPAASSLAGGGLLLVGHSMGGVVARAALAGAGPQLPVAALLLLASPQQYSPVQLSAGLAATYHQLNARRLPAGLPVISLNGGSLDLQVSGRLTLLWGLVAPAWGLAASTGDVPGMWAESGHNQVAWCNQLLRRLGLMLLEVVAPRSSLQLGVVHHHMPAQQHRRFLLELTIDSSSSSAPSPAGARPQPVADSLVHRWRKLLAAGGPAAAQLVGAITLGRHGRPVLQGEALMALVRAYLAPRLLAALAADQSGWQGAPHTAPAHTGGQCDTSGSGMNSSQLGLSWESTLRPECTGVVPPAAGVPRPPDVCSTNIANSSAPRVQPVSCPGAPQLDWYRQQAASRQVPAGAARWRGWVKQQVANEGSHRAAAGGVLLNWEGADLADRAAAGARLLVVVGAVMPCSGVRLWLQHDPAASGCKLNQRRRLQHSNSSWADVTSLLAPLPPLWEEHLYRARQESAWQTIMAGREYLGYSSWAAVLTPAQLRGAQGLALWAAATTTTRDGVALSPILTWQWLPPPGAPLQLGLLSWLRPLGLPAGGPGLLGVQLPLWAWMGPAAVVAHRWTGQLRPARMGNSTAAALPAHQLGQLGQLHLTADPPQGSMDHSAPGAAHPACHVPTWVYLAAGRGESLGANNSVALSDLVVPLPQSGVGLPAGQLLLLRDPGCGHRVALTTDLLRQLPPLLLTYGTTAIGLVAALMLLVLSHQMSALAALATTALSGVTQGQPAGRPPPRHAAGISPPPARESPEQQQQKEQEPAPSLLSVRRSVLLAAAASAAGYKAAAATVANTPAPRASLGGGPPQSAQPVTLLTSVLAVLGDSRVQQISGSLALAAWALSCAVATQQQSSWLQAPLPNSLAGLVVQSASSVQRLLLGCLGLWPAVSPVAPLWGLLVVAACGLALLLAGIAAAQATRVAVGKASMAVRRLLALDVPAGGDVQQHLRNTRMAAAALAACAESADACCATCYSVTCTCGPQGCTISPVGPMLAPASSNTPGSMDRPVSSVSSLWQCWLAWAGVEAAGGGGLGWLAVGRLLTGTALCVCHPVVGFSVAVTLIFFSWQPNTSNSLGDEPSQQPALAATPSSSSPHPAEPGRLGVLDQSPDVAGLGGTRHAPEQHGLLQEAAAADSPRASAALQLQEEAWDGGAGAQLHAPPAPGRSRLAQSSNSAAVPLSGPTTASQTGDRVMQLQAPQQQHNVTALHDQVQQHHTDEQRVSSPSKLVLARADSLLPPLWRWGSGATAAALGQRMAPSLGEWQGAAAIQLSQHCLGAWLLWYMLGLLVALPSAMAWIQLPLGQQHPARLADALCTLPVLCHAAALAQRRLVAFVGARPGGVSGAVANSGALSVVTNMDFCTLYKSLLRLMAAYAYLAALHGYTSCLAQLQAVVAAVMLSGDVIAHVCQGAIWLPTTATASSKQKDR